MTTLSYCGEFLQLRLAAEAPFLPNESGQLPRSKRTFGSKALVSTVFLENFTQIYFVSLGNNQNVFEKYYISI